MLVDPGTDPGFCKGGGEGGGGRGGGGGVAVINRSRNKTQNFKMASPKCYN